MKSLYLECNAGISGDMLVAALLDLGADKEALDKALQSIPAKGFEYKISRVSKAGVDCCDFDVILDEEHANHDHDMAFLHGNGDAVVYSHEHEHHHDHEHEHHHHHDEDDDECGCHEHDHHHHHHHADDVFSSWGKETPKKFSKEALEDMLHKLDSGDYGHILRAKGIVNGEDGWLEFDYVPEEHEVRAGHPDYTGRLCVIGAELKEDGLAELFGV